MTLRMSRGLLRAWFGLSVVVATAHAEEPASRGPKTDIDINAPTSAPAGSPMALDVDRFFHGYAVKPQEPGIVETTLFSGMEGRLYCIYRDVDRIIKRKCSTDVGRIWGPLAPLVDKQGRPIHGNHITMLRLKSGRAGLVYSTPDVPEARPGRDGGTVFRVSDDEGQTWSEPTVVERQFGICCSGHAVVLSTGRILVPTFKWLSHNATGAAEEFNAPSLSYSYVYLSDDDGQSWKPGLSELFVSHYRASYDLEEPVVVELKDGELLMLLRSQLGRMYRSFSKDQGMSWSRPEGLPFAAGYTPCIVRRIPTTDDLLMIWNQVSRMEILNGFHRHRLSCAISKDDGQTWRKFKNLESLDDLTEVTPLASDRFEVLEQWEDYGYYQPSNGKRYRRAPGVLRICYPDVAFVGDQAVIVYDYGGGTLGPTVLGTKLRAIPITWFHE